MKIKYETLDDHTMDLEDWQVERSAQKAAIDAIRRARQHGTDYVIWEDGRVKALKPNETAPYERAALENLERINQKISELERQHQNAPALVLNDKPKK